MVNLIYKKDAQLDIAKEIIAFGNHGLIRSNFILLNHDDQEYAFVAKPAYLSQGNADYVSFLTEVLPETRQRVISSPSHLKYIIDQTIADTLVKSIFDQEAQVLELLPKMGINFEKPKPIDVIDLNRRIGRVSVSITNLLRLIDCPYVDVPFERLSNKPDYRFS